MIPKENIYPVFEANQVLKNSHLNDLFEYLNEQHHLTRVNLIGIGIVCGLEMTVAADFSAITLSKGCGVTSGGHLVVIPDDPTTSTPGSVTLTRWKNYTAPKDIAYPTFTNKNAADPQQYDLFELFPTGEPDTSPLTQSFLSDKVLLLFMECNLENLKNCSPNSCDDRGQQVTVTLRKLLIRRQDLDLILAEAKTLAAQSGAMDIAASLSDRLGLPDLRLRRFDVDNSGVGTAESILTAYRNILLEIQPITKFTFIRHVGKALSDAYKAYQPLLQTIENTDPFSDYLTGIQNQYLGYAAGNNVVFTQYFYDLMDDLIQAYDEFRRKGLELMAMCCPPEGLFERHLMVGEIVGGNAAGKKVYRHYFRPAFTAVGQAKLAEEVRHLFQRMVIMVSQFNLPAMPVRGQALDLVKITPSRLGPWWLSEKAIPFHYKVNTGSPALYERWSYEKTSAGRARLNPGYHAANYANAPFVLNPLRYDIEPNNFFRIEGHVGLPWRPVVTDLLNKIRQYRLPFDVIALNADNLTVGNDPQPQRCISNDLRIIYNAWMKEAACLWPDKTQFFTNMGYVNLPKTQTATTGGQQPTVPVADKVIVKKEESFSKAGLLEKQTMTFRNPGSLGINIIEAVSTTKGTLGEIFTTVYNDPKVTTGAELKLNMLKILQNDPALKTLPTDEFNLAVGYPSDLIASIHDYAAYVPDEVDSIDLEPLELKYEKVLNSAESYYNALLYYEPKPGSIYIPPQQKNETLAQLRAILKSCMNKRIEAVRIELEKQDKAVKELIFFNKYVQKHPGIQHKAGVPVGGTFILVYRETPRKPATAAADITGVIATNVVGQNVAVATGPSVNVASETVFTANTGFSAREKSSGRFTLEQLEIIDRVSRETGFIFNLEILELTPDLFLNPALTFPPQTKNIPEGVIIADFFVPERCCSDCPPVQFVLPPPKPSFTATPGCTGSDGKAIVAIQVVQGTAPFQLSVDKQPYIAMPDELVLDNTKSHTLQLMDGQGGESEEVKVDIKPRMTAVFGDANCIGFDGTYNLPITVSNGVAPFLVNGKAPIEMTFKDGKHELLAGPFTSGQEVEIEVSDASGCPAFKDKFKHDCPPPPQPVAGDKNVSTNYITPVNFTLTDVISGIGLVVSIPPQNIPGTVKVEQNRSITFTPDASVSGQPVTFTYQVTDAFGNTDTGTVVVNVGIKPCDLPCGGLTERCRYPLWLTKPEKENSFQYRATEVARLEISNKETGEVLLPSTDLLKTVFQPILPNGSILTQADFDKKITEILAAINKIVDAKLGKNAFVLRYDAANGSLLTIEHFVCHDFKLHIEFLAVQGQLAIQHRWTYDSQQAIILQLQPRKGEPIEFQIPKFGCVMLDKCNDKVQKEDCRIGVQLKTINTTVGRTGIVFTPSFSPPPPGKTQSWWIIEWGLPAFGKGETMTTQLLSGNTAKVRLLLVDEKGCWDYFEKVTQPTQDLRPGVKGIIEAVKKTDLPKIITAAKAVKKEVKAPPDASEESTAPETAKKEAKTPPDTTKKSTKPKPKKGK